MRYIDFLYIIKEYVPFWVFMHLVMRLWRCDRSEYLMRKISFKVRNIGSEKYLSYILNDDCEFDEELLDYLEEEPDS